MRIKIAEVRCMLQLLVGSPQHHGLVKQVEFMYLIIFSFEVKIDVFWSGEKDPTLCKYMRSRVHLSTLTLVIFEKILFF